MRNLLTYMYINLYQNSVSRLIKTEHKITFAINRDLSKLPLNLPFEFRDIAPFIHGLPDS